MSRSQGAADSELRLHVEDQADLVRALQMRESLLQTLLHIQRAISNRAPLKHVLDTITQGAASLLGASGVILGQRDTSASSGYVEASSFHTGPGAAGGWDVSTVVAVALAEDEPVASASPDLSCLAIAVPVHAGGTIDGYLVATVPADEADPDEQRDLLLAFAQQVGLALADNRAAEAVHAARHDSLTGLPNRALFLERLEAAMFEARAWCRQLTVLFVDLDGFKAVNDTLGHAAGDELLGVVGRRLENCLRPSDVVARLGGDEFAILVTGADQGAGESLARRVIGSLRQPITVAGHEVFVTASVGAADTGAGAATAAELVGNADVAMYEAKRRGPGQVVRFEPRMQEEVARHLQLRSDLQWALERGQLSVQFQPVVEFDGASPVLMEALMRWTHDALGAISPAVFIPLAEETGAILELGRWVLREALRQLSVWRASAPGLQVSVNVAPSQLAAELPGEVQSLLQECGLPADSLVLEITESAVMRDAAAVSPVLEALRELGVSVAIDDFGTGHSSLAQLRRLPVDALKIDRSFVRDVADHEDGRAICHLVFKLAQTLGLRTVAEGVERVAEAIALQRLGCDLAQGYHFSHPMDPDAVPGYLQSASRPPGYAGARL